MPDSDLSKYDNIPNLPMNNFAGVFPYQIPKNKA